MLLPTTPLIAIAVATLSVSSTFLPCNWLLGLTQITLRRKGYRVLNVSKKVIVQFKHNYGLTTGMGSTPCLLLHYMS